MVDKGKGSEMLWHTKFLIVLALCVFTSLIAIAKLPQSDDVRAITLDASKAVHGNWVVEEGILSNKTHTDLSQVKIAAIEWPAYSIKMKVRRTTGTAGFACAVPVGEKLAIIDIDHGDKEVLGVRLNMPPDASVPAKPILESAEKFLDGLLKGEESQITIRNDGKELRVSGDDGIPLVKWKIDPSLLTEAKDEVWFSTRAADASWTIRDVEVRALETASEREKKEVDRLERQKLQAEKKKDAQPPRLNGNAEKDCLPAQGSIWLGKRDGVKKTISVTVKVTQVTDERFVMEVTDSGNAVWEYAFKRRGKKVSDLKVRYLRGANGAGRDVELLNEDGEGTISCKSINVQYSWNYKNNRGGGVDNGRIDLTPK